ncbi:hypothetical protein N0V94_000969 [Neodidymelliopsis sp. IMI 364377]|nr:hypothetical protein N0V94_000969 [Neodidymelliopsis sp. IMI 364377]
MPPQVTSQASEPTNISSSAPVGSVGTAGNSPLDALNEIDWNEIDKLFDGAEVGIGDMMIPPFTFPQFSPTDLQ